jgi:hypothetical protein
VAREEVVLFMETLAVKEPQAIEDETLKVVNIALLEYDLRKQAFGKGCFSLAMRLDLTTGFHNDNVELEGFLLIINKALELIGPSTATLSEPWTKVLL